MVQHMHMLDQNGPTVWGQKLKEARTRYDDRVIEEEEEKEDLKFNCF